MKMKEKTKQILSNPVIIIILALILAFYSSFPAFFFVHRGLISPNGVTFAIAIALSAFLTLFILPSIILKYVFRQLLVDFGLHVPENRRAAVRLTLSILFLSLVAILILSTTKSFQNYYLLKYPLKWSFLIEVLASGIYFFSEEFFFRGLLFFGLWRKLGWHTFWVTNLMFALLHFDKASGEMLFSFFAGLVLSYLSFRTKSFLPAATVHFLMALTLNLIIVFHFTL